MVPAGAGTSCSSGKRGGCGVLLARLFPYSYLIVFLYHDALGRGPTCNETTQVMVRSARHDPLTRDLKQETGASVVHAGMRTAVLLGLLRGAFSFSCHSTERKVNSE